MLAKLAWASLHLVSIEIALMAFAEQAEAQTYRREARVERRQARRQGGTTVYAGHERAVLGVTLGEDEQGYVQIVRVTPNSPADRAGLRPGDDILAINDQQVRSYRDVVQAVAEHNPNDHLAAEVGRNGRVHNVDIVLAGARSGPSNPMPQSGYRGQGYAPAYYGQAANYGNAWNDGNYGAGSGGYYGPASGYYGDGYGDYNGGYWNGPTGYSSGYRGGYGYGPYGNAGYGPNGNGAYRNGAYGNGAYGNGAYGNFGSQIGGAIGQRYGGNVGGAIGSGMGGAIENDFGW